MGNVYQSSGQVAGVGSTQSRVGQTLSGSVGRYEVFQCGQTFTEVGLDRNFHGLTCGVGHKTSHSTYLSDLVLASSGSRISHYIQVVQGSKGFHQHVCDIVCGLIPDFYDLLISLLL